MRWQLGGPPQGPPLGLGVELELGLEFELELLLGVTLVRDRVGVNVRVRVRVRSAWGESSSNAGPSTRSRGWEPGWSSHLAAGQGQGERQGWIKLRKMPAPM